MTPDTILTPAGIRAARERLGVSEAMLAARLDVRPSRVREWEAGTRTIDREKAEILAWFVASEDHDRAMEASGLPACREVEALLARLGEPRAEFVALGKTLDAHVAACETCRARNAFAETLPPVPPMPAHLMGGRGMRWFMAVADAVDRLPRWLRPAAWGALVIGGVVLLRVVGVMVVQGPSWKLLGMATMATLIGGYVGGVGGLAYHFVRPRTRGLGRLGDYLTGVASVTAYCVAFLLPMAITGDEMGRSVSGWVSMLVIAAVFGLVMGHALRDA